ncbi:MAG: UDP-N-acetylmuramoyl-L-alanine--D-glutamate ligase [Elusimicrobiota bacterium]|jgi:UDP-N-acetylmuramoylalanine--D-glutamate ligase|nr:UDP-N-acetylmuramoyl-L-alanine--D-glutamate ligase [Elusimicrobiota bacterium]
MSIKSASILGLGKSAIAAANLAIKLKYKVFASDIGKKRKIKGLNKKVSVEFCGHSDKVLKNSVIIKSPGIHSDIPIIRKALKKGIEVISELKFALNNSKYKQIIAVTGTNGKTTTTDLISKIVKNHFKDSIVCGNIGYPLSDKALKTTQKTIISMELSSYQLEDTPDFRPNISVLLNITPDHLEHHKSIANYIKAKKNILKNQQENDFAIINYENKICRALSKSSKAKKVFFSKKPIKKGVYYHKGLIVFALAPKKETINPKINIVGLHNIENILAASAACFCAGIPLKTIEKTISSYKGVSHRIEFVKSIKGVSYYNDSKSTTVDSTRAALESFKGNILLIIGGLDKGFPYTPLKKLIKEKVKYILIIGSASAKIKKDLSGCAPIYDCLNIKNAVMKAFNLSKKGDIVLFSPACASFDQFKNFEERGDIFKSLVRKI